MSTYNRFTDRFKFLTVAAANIDSLRKQVNNMLNSMLPSRILSKTNIFEIVMNVSQDISNLNMYYIENSLNENNILVAQSESSVRGLAELSGHKAVRPISARGSAIVTILPGLQLQTPALIFDAAILRCKQNNLQYVMIASEAFTVGSTTSSFVLNLIEGTWQEQKFVIEGMQKLHLIHVDDTQPIENYEIRVFVNNIPWQKFDSLYDMKSNDTGYLLRNGLSNQVDIVFGDDIHGVSLTDADTVVVRYLTTNGELGNVSDISESVDFDIISGVYDSSGNEIDVSEYTSIKYDSGFSLGSFGEHIDTTRNIAGYNSRALTFARPENLKAYLSRLTILSQIDVWTEQDDQVFNLLLLPNILAKITAYSDYLTLPMSELRLSAAQKSEILNMLNSSRRQMTSSEIVYHDPVHRKYALFIYVDADVHDTRVFKTKVEDAVSKFFLENTYADIDMTSEKIISRSAIVNSIYDMPEVSRIALNIFSEENEIARIDEYYDKTITITNGAVKEQRSERIIVPPSTDPSLGFTDLGDISPISRFDVPLLRGGFMKYTDENTHITLDRPIYIFLRKNNNWEEI